MSGKNPFAALDVDSDDEALVAVVTKKQPGKKKGGKKGEKAETKSQKKKDGTKGAGGKANPDNAYTGRDGKTYVGGRDKRGKREYDRHSGQRRDTVRKEGAGNHNWGKAEEQQDTSYGQTYDEGTTEVAATGNDADYNGEEYYEEEYYEPEIIEKTFEEYEAEKAEKRKGEAFKNLEKVHVEKIKDGKEYAKSTEEESAFMVMGQAKQKRVRDRKKNKAAIVDTGFTVKDQEDNGGYHRGGRGRGRGRGRGGRGGRGGGGDRGGNTYRNNQRVDTNNSSDFPALGA